MFCVDWRYRSVPFGDIVLSRLDNFGSIFRICPNSSVFCLLLRVWTYFGQNRHFCPNQNNFKSDCSLDISAIFHFNMSNISGYSSFFSKNILFLNIFWINLSLLSKITLSKRKGIKSQGIQCKKTAPSSGTVFISTLTFHHSRLFPHL